MKTKLLVFLTVISLNCSAQAGWTLWASGLPPAHFAKLAVAPNHDIFYGGTQQVIYKANTLSPAGVFTAMPSVPVPATVQNNVETLVCGIGGEPVAGYFRTNLADPFLFKFDNASNQWKTCVVDVLPTLGAFCSARAPNGDLWVGAKWAYTYKSTDNGLTFTRIDETPIIKNVYPCYYPTWGSGCPSDGAIYSINVDGNGRVYAGTECGGVVYSDDAGLNWKPADFSPCKAGNSSQKDSASAMKPISSSGNVGAIGFTANNNVIFNGAPMWTLNWNSSMGCADMNAHTVTQASGFVSHFIASGLQFTKIVTTTNGHIFMQSGRNLSLVGPPIGVYTSTDGINWTLFNTGITDPDDGTDNGSLAVDGNKVYMASVYGNVWMYDAGSPLGLEALTAESQLITVFPNPASNTLSLNNISEPTRIRMYDMSGKLVLETEANANTSLDISHLAGGIYPVVTEHAHGKEYTKVVVLH